MIYRTLISTSELAEHLEDPEWAVADCRFTLGQTERGRRDYLESHVPGAVYVHLNEDLCSPVIPGKTGRHPLPSMELAVGTMTRLGIRPETQIVVYDDWPGASGGIAARLWWMSRWLGHEAVAVLDGGWQRWVEEGRPVRGGEERRPSREFHPHLRPEFYASSQDVDALRSDPTSRVFDSRSADRYRGENETIDPVAGHIPGAFSAPYADNAGSDGRFRSPQELRERFEALLDGVPAERAVFYCGSGVTAAHNVLALAHAGLGDARLYVGSWSDWITDLEHPIALGE